MNKGLVYASTDYVNDPDDFLGTKLVLLSCIIGERWRRQGQEINVVIEWTSFRIKLCKCCWSFWMISKCKCGVFGVGDLTISLYHGIAYLSLRFHEYNEAGELVGETWLKISHQLEVSFRWLGTLQTTNISPFKGSWEDDFQFCIGGIC